MSTWVLVAAIAAGAGVALLCFVVLIRVASPGGGEPASGDPEASAGTWSVVGVLASLARDRGASPGTPGGFAAPTARAPAPVQLGASAPAAARPGDEFTARFVAYTPAHEAAVAHMLRSLGPRAQTHLGLETCHWQPGTRVTVRLAGRHVEVDTPEQTFAWDGATELVDFGVYVPEDAAPRSTTLRFLVAIEGVVVATVRLDLEITDGEASADRAAVTAEPARTAFASYASADRLRVLDRVAAVRIAAGLDVFVDCLSLRPSERWKPALHDEIVGRDLFLLFWSAEASASQWVAWEWRTALEGKGIDAMQLHPLGLADDAPPPEPLRDLHATDAYMLAREAYDRSPVTPGAPGAKPR